VLHYNRSIKFLLTEKQTIKQYTLACIHSGLNHNIMSMYHVEMYDDDEDEKQLNDIN